MWMQQKFSSSINLYGFGLIKNGVKFDFPFGESLLSMKPIVKSVYYALGDSEDETNNAFKQFEFVKTINTTWDKRLTDGWVISSETNKALKYLRDSLTAHEYKHGWGLYLQSDEVLHEEDYEILIQDIEYAEQNGYDSISLTYLHFWQKHDQIAITKNWYPYAIRLIKLDSFIESYADGQSFRNYKKTFQSDVRIFHYGHVREEKAYREKIKFQNSFHHLEEKQVEKLKENEENARKHKVALFYGNHPLVMKERILRLGGQWELDAVEEVTIVGHRDHYSPRLIGQIKARNINWLNHHSQLTKNHKNVVKMNPSILDYLFKRETKNIQMQSKHFKGWNPDMNLIMRISSHKIGFTRE